MKYRGILLTSLFEIPRSKKNGGIPYRRNSVDTLTQGPYRGSPRGEIQVAAACKQVGVSPHSPCHRLGPGKIQIEHELKCRLLLYRDFACWLLMAIEDGQRLGILAFASWLQPCSNFDLSLSICHEVLVSKTAEWNVKVSAINRIILTRAL